MTHKEMSEIFAVMLLAYPNAEVFKGGIAKLGPTINLWVTCLPEIDFWTGQQAVVKLVRECKFPPTIAEFKEKAEKVQAEVRARIDQAWNYLKLDMGLGKTPEEAVARLPEGTDIITIEKYEPRIPVARRHFEEAGLSDRITLLEGDAGEILKELDGSFDFIFMDAAKGQYIHWLPDILRLLSTGGVLFSDNVLQDGDIIESRFAVERRNRTIHARMREYLYTLTHMPEFQTSVVPIGDGVALSVKR